ncbi:MAG TPA: hypothetical protein VG759_19875 [Candidatus Angelobacter sp.]|jgi:hypothetical protein|nr:hypothetical protein [Candidatus Angelobacter sp.]
MTDLGIKQATCLGTELLIYEIDPAKKQDCEAFVKDKIRPWLESEGVKQIRALLVGTYLVVLVAPASRPWETQIDKALKGFDDLLKKPFTTAKVLLDVDSRFQKCTETQTTPS